MRLCKARRTSFYEFGTFWDLLQVLSYRVRCDESFDKRLLFRLLVLHRHVVRDAKAGHATSNVTEIDQGAALSRVDHRNLRTVTENRREGQGLVVQLQTGLDLAGPPRGLRLLQDVGQCTSVRAPQGSRRCLLGTRLHHTA